MAGSSRSLAVSIEGRGALAATLSSPWMTRRVAGAMTTVRILMGLWRVIEDGGKSLDDDE